MTGQFQFFQSLPHKKADFVKKKPAEHGVIIVKRKLAIMGISAIKNIDESEDVEKKIRILISWEYPSKKKGRSARIPPNL